MNKFNKVLLGGIGAIITVLLMSYFDVHYVYMIIVLIIFIVWSSIPNKYFYVSSHGGSEK